MEQRKIERLLNSSDFVIFLEEGLAYVDMWTPTEINDGGCGIFAKLLYDKLKSLGFDPKIIALQMDDDNKAVKALNDFKNGNCSAKKAQFNHIVVKLHDMYLDSTGLSNIQTLASIDKVELTEEQLDDAIKHSSWNDVFDVTCKDFIKQKLDEIFEHIDDFKEGDFKLPNMKTRIKLTKYTQEHLGRQRLMSMLSH